MLRTSDVLTRRFRASTKVGQSQYPKLSLLHKNGGGSAFSPYVDEELSILQSVLIVTLGHFATRKFLPAEKLTQAHGTLKTVIWQGKPVHIFPVYHPAAALRSPQIRLALEEDFEKVPSLLGELLPPQKDWEVLEGRDSSCAYTSRKTTYCDHCRCF